MLEEASDKKYREKVAEIEKKAAAMSAQFEQRAQETIEDLSQKARAKISKTQREFREAVETLAPAPKPAQTSAPARKLEVGARVRLKGVRQPATLRRILANGLLEVEAGFLKMQVSESDVEEVLPPAGAPAKPFGFRQGPSFDGGYRELNLIGQRAEEACDNLDKFLDSAALAAVDRVRIVHGHGMCILKKAVGDLLKSNPHVARYYVAPPEEGGSGSTIAELK